MPMQPRPRAETSRLLFPSLRFCTVSPSNRFSPSEIRFKRRRGGSLILPIYCPFLLLSEKSLVYAGPSGYGVGRAEKPIMMKKKANKRDTLPPERTRELRKELARRIASFIGHKERMITSVPGLFLSRRTAPTAPSSATYEPSLAVVAQGRKQANLAGTNFIFDQSRYLLTSLDLPVICNVIEASEQIPYLSFVLKLEMPVIRELLTREEIQEPELPADKPAMALGKTTPELLDACCRLVGLLHTPQDIPFLSSLIQREIIYRILRGPEGARLRAIATLGDQSHRTAKAIAWVKANFAKPLRVENLAD